MLPQFQYPTNALLDFSPVTNALARVNENSFRQASLENERTRLGYEGQRVGYEGERLGIEKQNAQREQEKYLAQKFGGMAQAWMAEADPTKQQVLFDQFVAHDPRVRGALTRHLPPEVANNPIVVGHYLTALAKGYENPVDVEAKKAQAYHARVSADAAMQAAQNGRSVAVPPGAAVYDNHTKQFAVPPEGSGGMESVRQKSAATELGKIDAQNEDKRRAGTEVERQLVHLEHLADPPGLTPEEKAKHDKAFLGAIGPIMSDPERQKALYATGMVPPEVKDLNNRMNHQIEGLTTAFMTAASSRGMTMSDARMQKFEQAMGAMRAATTKEEYLKITRDAKSIIRSIFAMPPVGDDTKYVPATPIPTVRPQGQQRGVTQGPATGPQVPRQFPDRLPPEGGAQSPGIQGQIPPDAIRFLMSNPTTEMRQFFDQKYGAGRAAQFLQAR